MNGIIAFEPRLPIALEALRRGLEVFYDCQVMMDSGFLTFGTVGNDGPCPVAGELKFYKANDATPHTIERLCFSIVMSGDYHGATRRIPHRFLIDGVPHVFMWDDFRVYGRTHESTQWTVADVFPQDGSRQKYKVV